MPHPTPFLIGLTGPAGSGKDATAQAIAHLTGATVMAFADQLRAEVCNAFGVPLDYLTNRETKEHPISALSLARCNNAFFTLRMAELHPGIDQHAPRSPRWVMQQWGTDYRRAQDATYWVRHAVRRMSQAMWASAVVTDVRFADEAQAVRDLGGHIWQVQRPGFGVAAGAHPSEVTGAQFAPDWVIDNSAGLAELMERVREALVGLEVAV